MEYREQQEGCTGRRKIHGEQSTDTPGRQKLSSGMAMILGALLTIEIMIGGAMILNFDFKRSGYHCCCTCHSWYYTLQWLPH